jgi:hypothetical protein
MAAYSIAAAISVISLMLGAAVCGRAGRWSWTVPAVGLAAAMLIATIAIRLPGHGGTAAAALAIAVAVSLVLIVKERLVTRAALMGVPTAGVVVALCSLPFLANDRISELGASMLDDLSFHLMQADGMRTLGAGADVTSSGYPIGPHALVAALAEGTAVDVSAAFTGLLLATPLLTALVALAALRDAPPVLRVLGAVVAGIPYLAASYLAEGAFKEPLLALFFLGFVLILRDAHRDELDARRLAALVITGLGGAAAFGVAALVWPASALVWLAVFVLARRRPRDLRGRLSPRRLAVLGACVVGALAAMAVASLGFFESGPGQYLTDRGLGGNYVGQLSPFQAFGFWPTEDFRFTPPDGAFLVAGVLLATAVVVHGALWSWRAREWALLAGALGALSIYVAARPVTLAYFSGKALVVAAPLLTLLGARALVEAGSQRRSATRGLATAALVAYAGLGLYSSALALRGAHVRPPDRGPDLAAFRSIVGDEPTLYLGRDNYAGWDLRATDLSGFQAYRSGVLRRLVERAEKAAGDADPPAVDVDSIASGALDRFRYVVGPRTPYASRMPSNYRPVARSGSHVLWERRGRTEPRGTLSEGEAPGVVFDCESSGLRELSRLPGRALVRARPVTGQVAAWRLPGGIPPGTAGEVGNGDSLVQELGLGRGTWDLSIRYFSDLPLSFRAGPLGRELPPYVGDPSSFFSVGRVSTRGEPLRVIVGVPERRRLDVLRTTLLGTVAATRVDVPDRLVQLEAACGRYVDWFQLRSPGDG